MALAIGPVIAGAIAGVLALKVVRLLISMGFAYAAYHGLDTFVGFIKGEIQSAFSGAGVTVVEVLTVLNLDRALNIVLAAYLMALVFKGMRGGTLNRFFLGDQS